MSAPDTVPDTTPKRDISLRFSIIAMVVILSLAASLRLYGLGWDDGYAWTPHPDERAILFKVAELSPPAIGDLKVLLDPDESPWNPRWFPYGSFPMYLLKGVDLFVPGVETGDLRRPARVLSALADVAVVGMLYLLGASLWSRRIGLLSAIFAAAAVIHIQLSHFFAVDTLLALSVVAALYFLARVARRGKSMDSALAGVCIGLGLAIKISILPIAAAYIVAHMLYALGLLSNDNDPDGDLASVIFERFKATAGNIALGAGVILGVFLIAQPYAVLDWGRFYGDFVEQSEMVRRIRDYPYTRQYVDTLPYIYPMRQLAAWGFGWPLGLLSWAGFVFVAVRGMRILPAAAYLAIGLALPMGLLLLSGSLIAIVSASGIAVAALIVTIPFRRPDSRIEVLLLSWVVPYFLIVGAFEVKFMRYLLPITPFLILFGSRMLVSLWYRSAEIRGRIGPVSRAVTAVVGVIVVVATIFYGLSYMGVYRDSHPAVHASEWVGENLPALSVLLKEHWEESLPDLRRYKVVELPMYEEDRPNKIRDISQSLSSADAIFFYSNRLYGTVPRLSERYPVSRAYYTRLFAGDLGYDLAAVFDAYPNLFGIEFADETFGCSDLPAPAGIQELRARSVKVSIELGCADESFTVYDHPKVMVFTNTAQLDADEIYDRITADVDFPKPEYAPASATESAEHNLPMLSQRQAETRAAGGTWTDIFGSENERRELSPWFLAVMWLLLIEGVGLLCFPLTFIVFRPLADRGWPFAKILGLLLICLITWILASVEAMAFTRSAIGVAGLTVLAVNIAILMTRRREIWRFVVEHWRTIALAEIVFIAAFVAFTLIRMANPDLWHAWRGGEKPMDMAYLNAVVKSVHMPPFDPWFTGGYLNYYYWGQFIVAVLIHATGILPEVAVNLAIPMFFALTVGMSYSVVFDMAAAHKSSRKIGLRRPAIAGLLGALFVAVLGNLNGAVQVIHNLWNTTIRALPSTEFDFWRSSRMMPPDPPGNEITEFPFFTFLFADPHAHLMSLPFTALCVGIALSVVLAGARGGALKSVWHPNQILRIVILGLAVGALRVINAWDYPTYLLFGIAAVMLGEVLALGGLSFVALTRSAVKSAVVFAVGYIAFLPYHMNYIAFFAGIESTTNRTPLVQFLEISGLFVFVIVVFCGWELRAHLARAWTSSVGIMVSAARAVAERPTAGVSSYSASIGPMFALAIIGSLLAFGYLLTALVSGWDGGTIFAIGALLAVVVFVGVRNLARFTLDTPITAFAALLVATGLALAIGLEVFRVEGDIDRMNSVFKFYLQIWMLLALGAAYMAWRLSQSVSFSIAHGRRYEIGLAIVFLLLLLSSAIFPLLGTQDRLRDRFDGNVTPLTLNGLAYIPGSTYRDPKGEVDLEADLEGIRWLRENVKGSPVVLEANTPTYRWGGRVSIHTGLPSVVGWEWHQQQQRWESRAEVSRRIRDVERIYSTTDEADALTLLDRYGVRYVYIGQIERLYYPVFGIAKFENGLSSRLREVFRSEQVTIYEVSQ